MGEIVIRCLGAVLLLTAAAGWGFYEIREGRQRIRELEAVRDMVRTVREGIDRLSAPLSEIYASYENPTLAACGFLHLLRTAGMERAVEDTEWRLSPAEQGILSELALHLGRGFREEQTALCRYAEDRLSDALEKRRADEDGRARLWRAIPLLAALSLILLLL